MSPDQAAAVEARFDRWERRLDKVIDDHEQRLRRCERWTYALPATAVVAAASIVVGHRQMTKATDPPVDLG